MDLSSLAPNGLAGVIAFETHIAEPDVEGGRLRYRGTDIEDFMGNVHFEDVWSLLVRGDFNAPLGGNAELPELPTHGDVRIDVQSGIAALASAWKSHQIIDMSPDDVLSDLRKTSEALLALTARSARTCEGRTGGTTNEGNTAAERFLSQWRGEVNPRHAQAIDAYWMSAAEHGMNASTFTARVVASTGADVPACISSAVGSMSGPLHGGAPARVLWMLDEVEKADNAHTYVNNLLDSGNRLMGFGHPVYRAEDPRARFLRRAAKEVAAPRFEAALALEEAALQALQERKPDRVLATNVEFWAAVLLDFAQIPAEMFTPMFTCARVAGWSAHIREQIGLNKIIRPSARYVGTKDCALADVEGYAQLKK